MSGGAMCMMCLWFDIQLTNAICVGAAQLGVFSGILGIIQDIFFLKFGLFQGMLFEKKKFVI